MWCKREKELEQLIVEALKYTIDTHENKHFIARLIDIHTKLSTQYGGLELISTNNPDTDE